MPVKRNKQKHASMSYNGLDKQDANCRQKQKCNAENKSNL